VGGWKIPTNVDGNTDLTDYTDLHGFPSGVIFFAIVETNLCSHLG